MVDKMNLGYKKSKFEILGKSINHIVLLFWSFVVIFPLLILVFTSFKTDDEYVRTSVFELPESLYLGNYIEAFEKGNLITAFQNSFLLVFVSSLGSVLMGAMAAYVLARFDFWGKKYLYFLYIMAATVPGMLLQIPIYAMFKELNFGDDITLLNSNLAILAPMLIFMGTDIIQLWVYLQYIESIPSSLDESAMIEGASYFRIFRQIILPLLKPATFSILIIKILAIYNELFVQTLYMSRDDLVTVTTALQAFQGNRVNLQNQMSAAILLIMLPTIIMFVVFQKYIFSGITAGASKE